MEVQILSHAPDLFCVRCIWCGEAVDHAAFIRREIERSNSTPERLRRLMIGRLPVEEYGASLNLVVAAIFAGVR